MKISQRNRGQNPTEAHCSKRKYPGAPRAIVAIQTMEFGMLPPRNHWRITVPILISFWSSNCPLPQRVTRSVSKPRPVARSNGRRVQLGARDRAPSPDGFELSRALTNPRHPVRRRRSQFEMPRAISHVSGAPTPIRAWIPIVTGKSADGRPAPRRPSTRRRNQMTSLARSYTGAEASCGQ